MGSRRARLIDLEGRTVGTWAVEGDPPPRELRMAATPKLLGVMADPEADAVPITIKEIVYRLEGMDGGGTLLYRRETGPWG